MINKLKPKSEFSRNVLTLMTGTTIAQAIPIAISPILTRIYTPEDFGLLALFVAITSIFASIANARYELAIMLPKKDEDSINIFALGFIITCSISLLLLILVILFHDYFVTVLNNENIGVWLYFVPIAVFFTGLYNILNYFNNRKKYYKDIANAIIIKSIVSATIQLSIGFLKGGVSGLISGQLISQMFANMRLFKNILKDKLLISKISKVKIIALAKRYKDFPKFSMWAGLILSINVSAPLMILSVFGKIDIVGFFMLAQKSLESPSRIIVSSMNVVLHKELVNARKNNNIGNVLEKYIRNFIYFSIAPSVLIALIFYHYTGVIFGSHWSDAGIFIVALIPLYMVRFIMSPMSSVISVMEWQKYGLMYQSTVLITSSIFYFALLYISDVWAVFLYSISQVVLILIYRFVMLYYLGVNIINLLKSFFNKIVVYFILGYIVNYLLVNKFIYWAIVILVIYIYIYIVQIQQKNHI